MTAIQVVLVLLGLFGLARTIVTVKRRTISFRSSMLWFPLWTAIIIVAVLPNTTVVLAHLMGVTRGADLAIYLALVLLFLLLFRVFSRIEGLERQMTKLVRAQALDDLNKGEGVNGAFDGPKKNG